MESLHDMKSVQDMGNSGSDKDINCVFGDILMAEDWWVSIIIAVDQLYCIELIEY